MHIIIQQYNLKTLLKFFYEDQFAVHVNLLFFFSLARFKKSSLKVSFCVFEKKSDKNGILNHFNSNTHLKLKVFSYFNQVCCACFFFSITADSIFYIYIYIFLYYPSLEVRPCGLLVSFNL